MLPAFLQAFVDVALVQFGVPHQRDHPPHGPVLRPGLGRHIVLHQRGKGRDCHPKADRAGREIHVVHVLGARGIGLHAAIAAEVLHLLAAEIAHQVLHGVEDRRGMGLDRHPVLRPQRGEIQRRQDRHHRGRGGLVPADLDPVHLGADVVGVVDHPVRQPQQPLLDGLQMGAGHGAFSLASGQDRPGTHAVSCGKPRRAPIPTGYSKKSTGMRMESPRLASFEIRIADARDRAPDRRLRGRPGPERPPLGRAAGGGGGGADPADPGPVRSPRTGAGGSA